MKQYVHTCNEWINGLSLWKRFWLACGILYSCAGIGVFVFHSVLMYFVLAGIVIWLRRI